MAPLRGFRRKYFSFFPNVTARRRTRNRWLRRFGLGRSYRPVLLINRPELEHTSLLRFAVSDHLQRHGRLTFMQIGAFDGVDDDDMGEVIRRGNVQGVLVEPQPAAFARLQANYVDCSHLQFINAAIDRESGMRKFYTPRNASVLSSFDRGHLLRHGIPSERIVEHDIPCLSVEDALKQAGFESLDLLQIDAEGHDYEIIKSIDFNRLAPAIIRFESHHFSHRQLNECLEMLAGHGYRFLLERIDVTAIKEDSSPSVSASQKPTAQAA